MSISTMPSAAACSASMRWCSRPGEYWRNPRSNAGNQPASDDPLRRPKCPAIGVSPARSTESVPANDSVRVSSSDSSSSRIQGTRNRSLRPVRWYCCDFQSMIWRSPSGSAVPSVNVTAPWSRPSARPLRSSSERNDFDRERTCARNAA